MRDQIGELKRWPAARAFTAALVAGGLALGTALFPAALEPRTLLMAIGGAATLGILLLCPELTLALYVVVGDLKGDDRVSTLLPVDPTLLVGAALLAGMALNLLRGRRVIRMPAAYLLYVALVVLMTSSLAYTPVLAAGVEKLGRFLILTGIVIVAPFFVLGTPQVMKRFLISLGIAAFAICAWSLSGLGGPNRLVTPSDNTIGLGHVACALILLIWFTVVPRCAFPWRVFAYLALAVPIMALIGSGARGATIACVAVLLLSLISHRRAFLDLACLAALTLAALPFAKMPLASLEYLGTLSANHGVGALLSFRGDLFDYGAKLVTLHPIIGVGIGGFPYYSPNPELYKWPHNIYLEIACELGLPAAVLALAFFSSALREAIRQLTDRDSDYFVFSQVAAALLLVGIINGTNTGDINSDRATWLFVSLVYVVGGIRSRSKDRAEAPLASSELEAC